MSLVRRRSRRRKSSYRDEGSGLPDNLSIEDLSPRARRLVESGVIDLAGILGSGDGGRITSGDILTAARLLEMEQSVPRIEETGSGDAEPEEAAAAPHSAGNEPARVPAVDTSTPFPVPPPVPPVPAPQTPMIEADPVEPSSDAVVVSEEDPPSADDSAETMTSATDVGSEPIEVPPSPWDAYNGSTEGLSESALPGAEQSWGEAEAHIAAMAEEAAQANEDVPATAPVESPTQVAPIESLGDELPTPAEPEVADTASVTAIPTFSAPQPRAVWAPAEDVVSSDAQVGEAAAEREPVMVTEPTTAVGALDEIHAVVDAEESEPGSTGEAQHAEVMMDFGTIEQVDPESVWAEGAEDFAPWFLANSKQLGDVLGLKAGLSDPRQFTTRSATGVLGRDDDGEEVVVVSSREAYADDSDLGRALGMAASSGAATVALVSAKFGEEQLQAFAWLNSQTKSGVKWFGIEMRVVRIADSPPAMMFDLVASPPPELTR